MNAHVTQAAKSDIRHGSATNPTQLRELPVAPVSTFGEAAKRLLNMGFDRADLLPIAAPGSKVYRKPIDGSYGALDPTKLGKIPSRYLPDLGVWCGLSQWTHGLTDGDEAASDEHAEQSQRRASWREAQSWPTTSVGLLAARYPALDADANDQSEHAEEFAEICWAAVRDHFGKAPYGIRGRHGSARLLFAAKANPLAGGVNSVLGALVVTWPDDGLAHKADLLAEGRQFVVQGEHPSGLGPYRWHKAKHLSALTSPWPVADADDWDAATGASQSDFDAILDEIARRVEEAGAKVTRGIKHDGSSGGKARHFHHDREPEPSLEAIFDALDRFPNTSENLPSEPAFFGFMSRLVAALGYEAENEETIQRIVDWAVETQDGHAEVVEEDFVRRHISYFLSAGVEHEAHAFKLALRDHGVEFDPKFDFIEESSEDKAKTDAVIAKSKADAVAVRTAKEQWLDDIAGVDLATGLLSQFKGWKFKLANMDTDEPNIRVTCMSKVDREDKALDWWQMRTPGDHAAFALLPEGHNLWSPGPDGMYQMLRELHRRHPGAVNAGAFYVGKTENPVEDVGYMTECLDVHGNKEWKINIRPLPECIRLANKLKPGSGNDHPDTLLVLKFMGMIFGRDGNGRESAELKYELDTLAFMAKNKGRPGNALWLQGESGCGKSVYASMLALMFNGPRSTHFVSGSDFADERSGHFAWLAMKGARIFEAREMVKFSTKKAEQTFEGKYKTVVDASEAGDIVTVISKGEDAEFIDNLCRFVATTNHNGILPMDEQERRTFYVVTRITKKNRPPLTWWNDHLRPVTMSSERMSHFMRYLMDRDISGYSVDLSPPVSDGKAMEIRMKIAEADKRHMTDFVDALNMSGRNIVTLGETQEVMSAISHNEFKNSDCHVGQPVTYKSGPGGNIGSVALNILERDFIKLDQKRTRRNDKRYTFYVRRGSEEEKVYGFSEKDTGKRRSNMAKVIDLDELLEALDRDRLDRPLEARHLSKAVRGPLVPPEPDNDVGGDFDDGKLEEAV